jgi:hypothetical protein
MVFKKNFIDVDPDVEKEKYLILKDIAKSRVAIIEETDKKEWWAGLSRQLGHETNMIRIDGERVIYPPGTLVDHHVGYIPLNKNFRLIEEKKGGISRFKIEKI